MMESKPHNPSRDSLAALKKALQDPGTALCNEYRLRLHEYVEAQLDGKDYTGLYPEIAVHLDSCLQCAAAYARVYTVELEARGGELPQSGRVPQPDLAFLQPGRRSEENFGAGEKGGGALLEQLRAALEQAGNRLILRLNTGLFTLLRPAPAAARLRSGERPGDPDLLLELELFGNARSEFPLRMRVFQDRQKSETAVVELTWKPPGREWPDLTGALLTLVYADQRRQAISDAWGMAIFENVPVAELPNLVIEIEDKS